MTTGFMVDDTGQFYTIFAAAIAGIAVTAVDVDIGASASIVSQGLPLPLTYR